MVFSSVEAKDNAKGTKKKAGKNAPAAQARPAKKAEKDATLSEGLFGVPRKGKDWFLTINDSICGNELSEWNELTAINSPIGIQPSDIVSVSSTAR